MSNAHLVQNEIGEVDGSIFVFSVICACGQGFGGSGPEAMAQARSAWNQHTEDMKTEDPT